MEIHYCQMKTEDGLTECGFLCGSMCRANPNRPFKVTADFHRYLEVIGCQSWQRYMEYDERRERFGQAALNGIAESGSGSESLSTEGTECRTDANGGKIPLQELPVKSELGTGGSCGSDVPPPMRVLQEGCTNPTRGNTPLEQSAGRDLGACSFCKEQAIVRDMGQYYCLSHAKKIGLI